MSENNIGNLIPYMQYKILFELDFMDLMNVFRINKYYYDLSNSENFWIKKIYNEFPEMLKEKPTEIKAKVWYYKIINSGNLHLGQYVVSNVSKVVTYPYYLDIFDNLWINNALNRLSPEDLPLCYRDKWENSDNFKTDCNIKDFYMTRNIIVVVKTNGKLYSCLFDEEKMIELLDNIVHLISNYHGCLALNNIGDLYWIKNNQEPIKVASSVKTADIKYSHGLPFIYYINDNNSLCVYRNIQKSYNNLQDLKEKQGTCYTNQVLIKNDIKYVKLWSCGIYIIDIRNKIWCLSDDMRVIYNQYDLPKEYHEKQFKKVCSSGSSVYLLDIYNNCTLKKDTTSNINHILDIISEDVYISTRQSKR